MSESRVRENRTHGLKGGRWGGCITLRGTLVLGRCAEKPPLWPGRDLNHNSGLLNQWPTSLRVVGFVRWGRNHPRIKENLSGGVGLVCGMECGISDR